MVLGSNSGGEFGGSVWDSVPGIGINAEFIVAALRFWMKAVLR